MINAVKVKCDKCGFVFWTEWATKRNSCHYEHGLTEYMEARDYGAKRQLESNK